MNNQEDADAHPRLRVLAVVVAYNSTQAIERCFHSLNNQRRPVDAALIVDNSDVTPVLPESLPEPLRSRTTILRTGENLGPAGGFALGLRKFSDESSGYSHAWLMDDDCYPEPESLNSLLDAIEGITPGLAAFPSAVYEATGVAMNYPGWSGVLLDRQAVEMAGLPREDMFWWAEDTEYLQWRLPRRNVRVIRVESARVLYDLIRRVGGRPAWKYYYEMRNMVWFRIRVQRCLELWKLPRTVMGLLWSAAAGPNRREKLHMYALGLAHGLTGRLGRHVLPPLPAEPQGD